MVVALADFFFIAGLDGLEPAILHPPTSTPATAASETAILKDGPASAIAPPPPPPPTTTTTTTVHETIHEEFAPPTITTTAPLSDPYVRPTTSSTIGSRSIPPTPPSVENTTNSIPEAESHAFAQQVIAKFTSEREDFLSTLAPPSLPRSPSPQPIRQSVLLEEEGEDEVSELGAMRSQSPLLRPRSSLRNKIADISRKASRSGTLKRRSTISLSSLLLSK
jgi:hypothetical protein